MSDRKPPIVKLCGLRSQAEITLAAELGAALFGLVLYPRSPRAVTVDEAGDLLVSATPGPASVAVTVNMTDDALHDLLRRAPFAYVQCHGQETPERIANIRRDHGVRVIKALPVAEPADLAAVADYAAVSDMLLFDAKPPRGATLPGGNGVRFDADLLRGLDCPVSWLLSGGLNVDNVSEAVRISGAPGIDVSSGIERATGQKDPTTMRSFMRAVHALQESLLQP